MHAGAIDNQQKIEPARVLAFVLVAIGHVALLIVLQLAMQPRADFADDGVRFDTVLQADFVRVAPPARPPPESLPPPPPPIPTPTRRGIGRRPADTAALAPAPREPPASSVPSTAAVFLDDDTRGPELDLSALPRSPVSDVFVPRERSPSPEFRPFGKAPQPSSNHSTMGTRLPGRVSAMQAYWAVPEGENLQGRLGRKVPILGLVLRATGAIGAPRCPPKSEHPDCLELLIDNE